jgi:putative ABC transport system ATP-binding protein
MIVLEGYTKYFNRGSVNEVLALENVSLEVDQGDFVTVVGSNGAGKSTLLNGIAGMFFPDKGTVSLNDTDITFWPEYRRAEFIGRVFQNPLTGTCASMTIEQNMAIAGMRGRRRGLAIGVKAKDRDLFARELKKIGLGLENRLKSSVGLLSGGQRQALTMVMATMIRPQVLLLDEHTAALDPKTARQILELTKDLVEGQGLTTLMVTHNMNHALGMGNRLIMLHRGKIILDIRGKEKEDLKKEDLLSRFYQVQGEEFATDRVLLA